VHELANQTDDVRRTIEEMRRAGLRGVGMSSWGPACFGFAAERDADAICDRLRKTICRDESEQLFVTQANNTGAEVISRP
jgi:predicted sugar kinase